MNSPNVGLVHRISHLVLASIVAVLTNSSLVLLEPQRNNTQWAELGGSPFGCPLSYGDDACNGLPTGLSRIVSNPQELSNGCLAPCLHSHSYADWYEVARRNTFRNKFPAASCMEINGLNVSVTALGRNHLRDYFVFVLRPRLFVGQKAQKMRINRERWIVSWSRRAGLSSNATDAFLQSKLDEYSPLEYLKGLVTHLSVPRFQPWVVEDVNKYLSKAKSRLSLGDIPLVVSNLNETYRGRYDAIHVRRGDRVLQKSYMVALEEYYVERGFPKVEVSAIPEQDVKQRMKAVSIYPTSYIPFECYWEMLIKQSCSPPEGSRPTRPVFIATDDVDTVQDEILNLTGHGVVFEICSRAVDFVFTSNPNYAMHIHLGMQTQLQKNKMESSLSESHGQYLRTISALADLHLLCQSDVLIAEVHSYWGRLLTLLRTSFADGDAYTVTKEVRPAWGRDKIGPPWRRRVETVRVLPPYESTR